MSWEIVSLKDICDLQNGFAFKSSDYIEHSNTLNCRMSNIRPGGYFDISYNPKYLPDSFIDKYSNFLLKDGDVVIAMTDLADAPKILGVPTVIQTLGKNILLNQRVGKLIIKNKSKVYFPYLQRVLNFSKTRVIYKKFAGGGLQINLGKKDLLSIKIPLPPLAEQKRIAEILDATDALRTQRRQAIALLDDFLQATFLDMFGDPVANPKGWDVEQWQNVLNIINGRNQKAVEEKNGTFPIFGSGGEMGRANSWLVEKNSVVVGRKGNINRPLIVKERFWNVDTAFGLVPRNEVLSHNYLFWFAKFFNFERLNKTVTIPSLTKSDLLKIKMPIPPLRLQDQFTEIVEAVETQKDQQQAHLAELDTLFACLQQRAFAGEL